MKKLLLVLCVIPLNSVAQTQQLQLPVICSTKETVFEVLTGDEFKEIPIWLGRSSNKKNHSTLFINEEKGTWTLVKFDDNMACMLDTGDQSKLLIKGEKIKKM